MKKNTVILMHKDVETIRLTNYHALGYKGIRREDNSLSFDFYKNSGKCDVFKPLDDIVNNQIAIFGHNLRIEKFSPEEIMLKYLGCTRK